MSKKDFVINVWTDFMSKKQRKLMFAREIPPYYEWRKHPDLKDKILMLFWDEQTFNDREELSHQDWYNNPNDNIYGHIQTENGKTFGEIKRIFFFEAMIPPLEEIGKFHSDTLKDLANKLGYNINGGSVGHLSGQRD